MTVNAAKPATQRPALQRLERGNGHSYKLDGEPVPGVTTLISKGLAKPALVSWSAKCVAEYVADATAEDLDVLRRMGREPMIESLKRVPWAQRDRAAVSGTAVHAIAEKLIHGERVDVPDELAGHVESTVAFLDVSKASPVLTETVVASRRYKFAGTLDAVVDMPDGRRLVLDFKTSRSGIFPEVALQMSAYRHADFFIDPLGEESAMSNLDIDGALAVHIRADGWDAYPVETGPEVFKIFLHVATVARSLDQMPGWIGGAETFAEVA
jgi:hypothetical protein